MRKETKNMGLFSDILAISNVQKIKNGKTAKLSMSQITGLITNMTDARNNLNREDFQKVYKLFLELRKWTTKLELNYENYIEIAIDVIKKFDKIAPYEKYSGGNELEFSFFMKDIRESQNYEFDMEELNYIEYILTFLNNIIYVEDAEEFINVLRAYSQQGKTKAIDEFDFLAQKITERNDIAKSTAKVSFLLGVLNANNIIDENEMSIMKKQFIQEMQEQLMRDAQK